MGVGRIITCYNCNTEKEILEGIGMLHSEHTLLDTTLDYSLLNYCDETSNLDKNKLLKVLEQDNCYLNKNYGYKIYICPKCNYADSYFHFILYTTNGKIIPEYLCKHCNGKMRIVTSKDNPKYYCDNCNQTLDTSLNILFMNWD